MKSFRIIVTAFAFFCTISCIAHAQYSDLLLYHGKIVTVDRQFSIKQAIAISNGRIDLVGGNAEVLKRKGPKTRVVELGGRTVIPGLIDSHTHPVSASMTEFDHPIPPMETIADVLDYLRGRA